MILHDDRSVLTACEGSFAPGFARSCAGMLKKVGAGEKGCLAGSEEGDDAANVRRNLLAKGI